MTAPDRDPFDNEGAPNLSFKDAPVGTVRTLIANGPAEMVQQTDYDTGEPATWDDGNPKMAAVVSGVDKETGEPASIWAPKTKKAGSKFAAIAKAQKDASHRIGAGTEVALKLTGTEPSTNSRKEDRKLYAGKVTPPAPSTPGDAFGDEPPF